MSRGHEIEVEVMITGATDETCGVSGDPEPCESCGTPVMLISITSLVDATSGRTTPSGPSPLGRTWCEVHRVAGPGALFSATYRTHTSFQCRRVRAGRPYPLWGDLGDADRHHQARKDQSVNLTSREDRP